MRAHYPVLLMLALLLGATAGCQSAYYSAMETLGQEKRDILRSELTGMVGDQQDAEEAFTDALTRMKELTGFHGGELEEQYDRLKGSYEDAKDEVGDIDDRMGDIDQVANDMFREWDKEIGQMSTPSLKSDSRRKLRETRERYRDMYGSLEQSRAQMDPVLTLLNDHVLYLKHNLNAAAVGALERQMGTIEASIGDLRERIQASIREAESFLAAMQ